MNRAKIFLIIAMLLLSSCAYAIPETYGEFLASTADAIGKFLSELAGRLVFMGMVWTKISNVKYEIYDNLPYFLLNDPQPGSPEINNISRYFISILEPLYVMAILITGIYLLFFSGTPQGRVRAKAMLISLIMGMVVISVSTYLIQLLFDTSNSLTKNILGQGPLDVGFTYRKAVDYLNYRAIDFMWTNVLLGMPFMLLSLLITTGIFIMLAARYFFLIFLIIFFPIAIFLTLFPLTKTIGNILLRQLVFWAFLPSAYALMLVTIGVSSQNLTGVILEVSDIISLTGTLILIASPLVIFGVMDWIGVFISYTLQFVRLTGPVTFTGHAAQASETTLSGERRKTKETRSAVGMRGYAPVEEEAAKKEKDAEGAALGFGGYRTAGEISPGSLKRKKPQYSSMFGYDENRILPPYGYENASQKTEESGYGYESEVVPGESTGIIKKEDGTEIIRKADGTEIVRNPDGTEYVRNAKSPQNTGTEVRGVSMMQTPVSTKEPQKKDRTVQMKLHPKYSTTYEVEVAPGESAIVTVVLVNDGKIPFFRVTVYDEGISDAGFDLSYSTRSFSLKPGEEKQVKIKIAADPNMDKKTYEGEIIFKTEKMEVKSTLEMIIKTGDEKEKLFEEEETDESDIGFTHSAEQEEKKEKVNKRNIFGAEEEVDVKKKDAKKEGEKGSTKETGKPKEDREPHRAPIMRTAQQPEMEMASREIPPALKTSPPLTTSARSPKQAKLLRSKDKKEKEE
ncbi:MAG: hypothetical protein WAX07_07725 [Candidatus Altiarchaeia archaeon]